MPVGTLDSILGIAVPVGAFIFLGFVIYKGFKEPIDDLLHWIKGMFGGGSSPQQEGGYGSVQGYGGGRPKRNPFGMDTNDISYR